MKLVLMVNPGLRRLAAELSAPGLEVVCAEDAGHLVTLMPGTEVLIVGNSSYTEDVAAILARHGQGVSWLFFVSAGTDNLDRFGAPDHVAVSGAGGLRSRTVAEHGMALLLALVRQVPRAVEERPAADWWGMTKAMGGIDTLEDKTLLCLGYGGIGREVARKAKAFDMRVIAVNRSGEGPPPADRIVPVNRLRDHLADADVVMLAAPSTPETLRIIDADALRLLRPGSLLVNIARGELVDTDALVEALKDGRLAGAALDVVDPEPLPAGHVLWAMPNVLVTPHVAGGGSADVMRKLGDIVRTSLDRMAAGEPPLNLVRPASRSR